MDREARNSIQRATQAAREVLENEYAEQLEGVFDIRLDGTIATESGVHLNAAQRVLRSKIVAAMEHQRGDRMTQADAVGAYLREAAFTTLNRLVALKILEALQLVQECISRGDRSAGFKEFTGLAAGLVQRPDHGYRIYIESIFDEIGREVRVLFDRRDPASLLWPRRRAILSLLDVLNSGELISVWAEEETIGWVYQYFNSDLDRQEVRYDDRGKPKTPESSYELAVRNQFFTPHYVVRFLADNTLGRIWYEMRRGDTLLRELEYLVRRPNERFLDQGEELPGLFDWADTHRTQEEMLQRPFHVPFREKKDPRDILVLDPACGSGHFLLYAFDLLRVIYEEAWDDNASPVSEATGSTLHDDYLSFEALQAVLPDLILRHNLYGIDIDTRCVQIAAVALWIRAQREYKERGILRAARSPIRRVNIVVAEPIPGNPELRRDFLATLASDARDLVGRVFDRLRIADEAGSLLRVDLDIRETIREVYPAAPGELLRRLDEDQWQRAEKQVLRALKAYAQQSKKGESFRRRLFADDAVRGLGFVDLCSQRYDVVLMNPPFGDGTASVADLLAQLWPNAKRNLYIAFVYRALELLSSQGLVGAITDASFIHQTRYENYRRDLLDANRIGLRTLISNGWGVLDAYVETACLVAGRSSSEQLMTFDARATADRENLIQTSVVGVQELNPTQATRVVERTVFNALPKSVLAFWLPAAILDQCRHQPTLDPHLVDARCGMSSSDNPRFYKVWWEVDVSDIGESKRWRFLANGGPPSPLYRQQIYVMNWGQSGSEAKSRVEALYGNSSRTIINEPYYFRPGLTFAKRTESFTAQYLPAGEVFSNEGQAIFPHDLSASYAILGFLNSSMVAYLLNSISGQHKEAGYVGSIPAPPSSYLNAPQVAERMRSAHRILLVAASCVPESQVFCWPLVVDEGPSRTISSACERLRVASDELEGIFRENDRELEESMGLESSSRAPWRNRCWRLGKCVYDCDDDNLPGILAADYIGYLLGLAFGRWSYYEGDPVSAILRDPFRCQAARSPAMTNSSAESGRGILVDDPGHDRHVVSAIEAAHSSLVAIEAVASDELVNASTLVGDDDTELSEIVRVRLFATHLERYSKSRRKTPIYWHVSTPSTSYSVWLYYHGLTRETFYTILNEYMDPKLRYEERKLIEVTHDKYASSLGRRRQEIERQERLVAELRTFRDEIILVAPIWNPDLNDGVIVNFAPLWRLLPHHRAWQRECKTTWDRLLAGDYDWSGLSMHLWPERVVLKCATDRSLAIAHNLQDVFWYEDPEGKWRQRDLQQAEVEEQIELRTSAAVKDALQRLIDARAPTISRWNRGRTRRKKGTRKSVDSTLLMTNESSLSSSSASSGDGRELLGKVAEAIAASDDGARKGEVLQLTGITSSQWNRAIKALLDRGAVIQTGERRGARYHLGKAGA